QGRLMITLLNNQPTGAHREVIWDGRDKNGQRVRMGIYIIFIEAIEESGGFNKTAKQTIVVGKRL
ncbi:MAG TPA: hypothetical protein PKI67_13080, partial [bacterium]|nr:hypothetical protein [bacterium]